MEKITSLSSGQDTIFAATATSCAPIYDQNYVSPPPFQTNHQQCHQDIAADFSSMYNFIFPPHSLPLSPSSCSSSSSNDSHLNLNLTSDAIATKHRLKQARLVLEYDQLCDHYNICFARLQALNRDIETLRRENSDLLVANNELMKLLNLSSMAVMNNRNLQRKELPKSVSVRSSNYLKLNHQQGPRNQQRVVNPLLGVQVSSEWRREKAIELNVYNQGMAKTELCDKWEEIGSCPYGEHCQFAHGITELRPVIRHPRYKTQACRMVLAGQICPYGHRCHFRHSLTE
ncbi:hypothetical protein ERO13_D12G054600v2 [Gossypium hirsutum]|uniref:Zinc finger CCCH domain-containing protein 14 n=2 Tax=Gossypium TaxID=3633 RepID=A0A1U8KHT6_GOSHI|nr:zinc finger CCCH domain-containing protein 14-like [Gossypium hirsutum]KAG4114592.1 hypothetical protein ERO13_D12G054600v2 [Gossypium hirsutum]TYH37748.1 hypothetical protein ES332_D12G061800v1 [Gossypium tomentosum]